MSFEQVSVNNLIKLQNNLQQGFYRYKMIFGTTAGAYLSNDFMFLGCICWGN